MKTPSPRPAPKPQQKPLTIAALAAALQVSLGAIDRAIAEGRIVPTFRTASGRARFSVEYAEKLKSRADAARAAGATYVLGYATGTRIPRRLRPKPRLSAKQFIAQLVWKHRAGLFRSSPSRAKSK
jgi:hypothetical protein